MKQVHSNRFWLLVLGSLVLLSGIAAGILFFGRKPGSMACIYLDGALQTQIDLSTVTEPYTLSYTGSSGITNLVEVAPGKIRVQKADCPDQICVHQGWIQTSIQPVICLPNALVIQIDDAPDTKLPFDAWVN